MMQAPDQPPLLAGQPRPLGATPVSQGGREGVNFAVRAPAAEDLWLTVRDAADRVQGQWPFPAREGEVFHGFLAAPLGGAGLRYTVSTTPDGPALVEPYARQVLDPQGAPRAVVVATPATVESRRPATPWADTVICEVHVRGYTMLHPDVPPALRGTYLGLAHPAVIGHLQSIGVTAVELLPVQCFRSEDFLRARGLANYWGYNPLAWFAPAPEYAVADPVAEFREMVAAYHAAGIEVILDVVFNHTCEGGAGGPVLSWRGLDDAGTYRRLPNDATRYDNLTGCGNTVDLSHAPTREMVVDCLRWWAGTLGVDGFRFDLAPVLGRGDRGFDPQHPFFAALQADPVLAYVKWVAEPWDIGPGGYQLGRFPPGWAEWNDRYRDTVRGFWRGDGHGDRALLGQFAERLSGSADLFRHDGRKPWASINLVCTHDGYTLRDLVSFEQRHNLANGEDNRDGHAHNLSWNCGAEGDTLDAEVLARRARQQRNFLLTLFLSQGTPLLQGGDELGRTQLGNNNAYCQDNALSWVDWATADHALTDWVRALARLRRERPELRRDTFLKGAGRAGRDKDVAWLHPDGREMRSGDWSSGQCVLGLLWSGHGERSDLLWLGNPTATPQAFHLPRRARDGEWRVVLDSASGIAAIDMGVAADARHLRLAEWVLRPHQSVLLERTLA